MPNEVIIDGVRYAPDISSTPNADAFFVLLQKSRVENAALNARLEEIEGQAESENTALKARLERELEGIAALEKLVIERGARLEVAKAAAKTWENEAERRSRRYEQAAVRLAEATELVKRASYGNPTEAAALQYDALRWLKDQKAADSAGQSCAVVHGA